MSNETKRSILDHFFQIGRRMRHLNAMGGLGAEELTMHQMHALFCVKRQQPMRMSQLAEELRVAPGTATILVDRLVESGWLVRTPSEDDRRTIQLELSPDANQKFEKIMTQRLEQSSLLLDVLTPAELTQLDQLLGKLEDSL
jgi:DNA-binding MarR family transcriptional regulator